MEKEDILNFSNFFGEKLEPKTLNRDDFKDFFLENKSEEKEKAPEYPKEVKVEEPEVEDSFDPPVNPESFVDFEEPEELDVEESLPEPKYKLKESKENFYLLYNDKAENFICDVYVEGAKINETQARLILESDDWNLIFEGEIDRYGKCSIPIKKLNIFDEGLTGKIRLEVIAENTVFVPWEDNFKVKTSKKVLVKVQENRSYEKPKETKSVGVKVNFKK